MASQERPFTLTVFILGGAGYLDLGIDYVPSSGEISSSLDVGVFASASLGIEVGPIKGSVYAYFGLDIHFKAGPGHSSLHVAIVLMFGGNVCLIGLVFVSLNLSLSAIYEDNGRLRGRGTVSYHIRLGPFWEIEVNSSVEYVYGNPAVRPLLGEDQLEKLANEYYDLFLN